jgi:methylated-DNA-[protein]-cysteine S-methyltransferase
MPHRVHTMIDSPIGPLTLVAEDGALAGLYMTEHRHQPSVEAFGELDPDALPEVRTQLAEYFAGTRTEFDLPLAQAGTEFQRAVWTALLKIPYGQTRTYGELAEQLGNPKAVRAVGLANGKNPISVIVPCHRVIGSSGDLTGYGGGIARKRHLLEFERGSDLFSAAETPGYQPMQPLAVE